MNIQRIQLIWAAAVLLAAGCSQEPAADEGAYSDVRIEPRSSIAGDQVVVQPQEATRAAVDPTNPMTFYLLRANETGADTDIYHPYSNTVLSATRAGGAGVQPLTFASDLFYLSSGAKSKLTGWYPAADSFVDGVPSWNLDGTQDVLTVAAQKGSLIEPMPTLAFRHSLSQLNFYVRAKNAAVQAACGVITSIRVFGQPTVCRYTPATNDATGNLTFEVTDSVTYYEAKNLLTSQVSTTLTLVSAPMMIVPQKDHKLTVEIKTSTGMWSKVTIAYATTYEPGKAYNINIHLGERDIAGEASVGDWIFDNTPQPPTSPMPLVDLSKNGTANCYVITENFGQYCFFDATKRGNNNTGILGLDYDNLPKLTDATEARVIWQTGTSATTGLVIDPALVKLSSDKSQVRFALGDATEGNAVIGLFPSSDPKAPCIWSWHIWRVDGALPADVACVKTPSPSSVSPNFKMMALNLGAFNNVPDDPKSIGLMYQWGRKDPFPKSEVFSAKEPTNIYGSISNNGRTVSFAGRYTVPNTYNSATNSGTEAWAVQYPGVFITGSAGFGDWMTTQNDYLWGTPWVSGGETVNGIEYNGSQGSKSIYDPCPVGYRVPPQDTWNKAVEGVWGGDYGRLLKGIVSSDSFWFPALIGRQKTTGVISFEYSGRYWSSSIQSSGSRLGGYLCIDDRYGVKPKEGYERAYGLSVRCVAE